MSESPLRDGWLDRQCRIAERQVKAFEEYQRQCRMIVVEEFAKDGIDLKKKPDKVEAKEAAEKLSRYFFENEMYAGQRRQ